MGPEYIPMWMSVISLVGVMFTGLMAFLSRSKAGEALAQGKINEAAGEANAKKAEASAAAIAIKAEQIHELTNSRLSELDKKLATAMETIAALERQIANSTIAALASKIQTRPPNA